MCDLCDSSVAAWESLRHHCGMFLDMKRLFSWKSLEKVQGSSEQTKQVHPSELKSFRRHIPIIGLWRGFDEHEISFEFALFQVILFNHH